MMEYDDESSQPSNLDSQRDWLQVIQVNARSLCSRIDEVRQLIATQQADIIAVQETWLSDSNPAPILPGFVWYGVNRVDRSRGGVGFYIRDHVPFRVVEERASEIERATITIHTRSNQRVFLTCLYAQPRSLPNAVNDLQQQRLRSSLLLGDFNAHHPSWSKGRANQRGTLLRQLCHKRDLQLHGSPSEPTLICPSGRHSTPDLLLAGSAVASLIRSVSIGPDVGSDHLPILFQLQVGHIPRQAPTASKFWRTGTLRVDEFRQQLSDRLPRWRESQERQQAGASDVYAEWAKEVKSATAASCKAAASQSRDRIPSWLRGGELRELIQSRRRLRRQAQQRRDMVSYLAYREATRTTTAAIRQAKQRAWQQHCAGFDSQNMFRRLSQLKGRRQLPVEIKTGAGERISTDKEIAERLGGFFSSVGSDLPPAVLPAPRADVESHAECQRQISREEIQVAIGSLKRRKAPGRDGIFNFMLLDGGRPMLDSLVFLFQRFWSTGEYPAAWTVAEIKPLMKSGRVRSESDFRPISLLSVVAKLFEAIVRSRITAIAERQAWVPSYQAGFRAHRSPLEHLVELQQASHTAFHRKEVLLAAFLDLSKAYDTVSRPLLLRKLEQLGIDSSMLGFLRHFLGQRSGVVRYRDTEGSAYAFANGVPQGSPLSPFLFNIYIAEALNSSMVTGRLYADDITLWTSASTLEAAEQDLTAALSTVHEWASAHRMKFSPTKCCVLKAHRCRVTRQPMVQMGPLTLAPVATARYLGVVFDRSLSFRQHIDALLDRKTPLFNQFQQLTNIKRGVHQSLLTQLYSACLRPALEFASVVWADASITQRRKVQSLQHQGLVRCLGVNRISHTADVCVEAGVPPLGVRQKVDLLRYWRQLNRNPVPLTEKLRSLPQSDELKSVHRSSFLQRLRVVAESIGRSLEEVVRLPKSELPKIEYQLWRRQRELESATRLDPRSVAYAALCTEIGWKRPASYESAPRPVVAIWHMLRLGSAPLNAFLHSIGCAPAPDCLCGGGVETVEHYLLHCSKYAPARARLRASARPAFPAAAQMGTAELLGNPLSLADPEIDRIFTAVTIFISDSRRFTDLVGD